MTGEEKLEHNDQFRVEAWRKQTKIVNRGARFPNKIIEDIGNNEE